MGLEDLDALQTELESLLVSVTRRQLLVEDEMEMLVNWQDSQSKPKDKKTLPKVLVVVNCFLFINTFEFRWK